MFEETTTFTTSNSLPTLAYESTAPPSKKLTMVTRRLLCKPNRLKRLSQKHLIAVKGPHYSELMIELYEETHNQVS